MSFSTAFDEAMFLVPIADGNSFTARTTPAYHNMIGPFGGITFAVVLEAVSSRQDILGQPLSLTLSYIKVVAEGEYLIHTHLIGQTRTTQHFSITVVQNEEVVLQGLALFGTLRPLTRQPEISFPQLAGPENWPEEDLILPWSQNYEFRFVSGGIQERMRAVSSEKPNTETQCWLRNNPPRNLDFPALAAISDSFVPRAMLLYQQMIPIGTVSLTTYFHASSEILQEIGDDYVLTQARAINFGEGWYDHIGYIWSRTGTLLATTTQMVYFKPPA